MPTDDDFVAELRRLQGIPARVLDDPQDPYTQRLRASVPRPGWKPRRRALARAGEEP